MESTSYRLYVPTPGAVTHISPGSAIVGDRKDDWVDVHFERGGASNVQTFEEKILHAAGRRAQSYPTIARGRFPADELVDVGSVRYDALMRRWVIDSIDDPVALETWAPGPHVVGGSEELRREAAGLLYSRMGSSGMTDVAMTHAAGTPMVEAIFSAAARPGRLR